MCARKGERGTKAQTGGVPGDHRNSTLHPREEGGLLSSHLASECSPIQRCASQEEDASCQDGSPWGAQGQEQDNSLCHTHLHPAPPTREPHSTAWEAHPLGRPCWPRDSCLCDKEALMKMWLLLRQECQEGPADPALCLSHEHGSHWADRQDGQLLSAQRMSPRVFKSWHNWPSQEHIATPCPAVRDSSFMIWDSFLLIYLYSQWSKTCKALCLKNNNLQVLITSTDFRNPSEITPWGKNDFPLTIYIYITTLTIQQILHCCWPIFKE